MTAGEGQRDEAAITPECAFNEEDAKEDGGGGGEGAVEVAAGAKPYLQSAA